MQANCPCPTDSLQIQKKIKFSGHFIHGFSHSDLVETFFIRRLIFWEFDGIYVKFAEKELSSSLF